MARAVWDPLLKRKARDGLDSTWLGIPYAEANELDRLRCPAPEWFLPLFKNCCWNWLKCILSLRFCSWCFCFKLEFEFSLILLASSFYRLAAAPDAVWLICVLLWPHSKDLEWSRPLCRPEAPNEEFDGLFLRLDSVSGYFLWIDEPWSSAEGCLDWFYITYDYFSKGRTFRLCY